MGTASKDPTSNEFQVSSVASEPRFQNMEPEPTVLQAEGAGYMYSTPIRKQYKRWPYIVVTICFLVAFYAYLYVQLPEYRVGLRYSLNMLFGSEVEDREWVGGHREIVDFVFVYALIGLPTMIGGAALAGANALPPVPTGLHRTLMRFMKRKLVPARTNLTYAESFCTMLYLGLNAVWFSAVFTRTMASQNPTGDPMELLPAIKMVGYVLGFNAVLGFSVIALPATRNCFWFMSVGVDYAHSIKYHRWIGFLTIGCVFAHVLPYYIDWISKGTFFEVSFPCFNCDIGSEGKHRLDIFGGQLAFFSCVIILATSLGPVRRRFYSVFYYCHHLFLLVLVGMVLHFGYFVIWMYPSVCLYVMHRILSRSQSCAPTELVELEAIPGDLTRIVFRRCPGKSGLYHAGQFIYLRIPALATAEWHPFSISSSPIEWDNTFTVHIKAAGPWTTGLYALAEQAREEERPPLVYVDGFYGNTSDEFQHYPALVLLCGGIGSTPLISMLGKILDCMSTGDPAVRNLHVYFHWTSREIAIFHEFEPLLDAIEAFDPTHSRIRVSLHFTGDQHNAVSKIPETVPLKPLEDTQDVPKRPFAQAAVSAPRQMVLFFLVFTASFFCVLLMRLGYPVLGYHNQQQQMWPLQRILELLLMIGGAAVGWIVVLTDNRPKAKSEAQRAVEVNSFSEQAGLHPNDDNRPTYSHSLELAQADDAFKHPVLRTRLNVKEVFNTVVEEQSTNYAIATTGIGTWVCGPTGLINMVENEAANFAGIFDVHSEEFEL